MIALAATNTIVQTVVPEHLRGRVMAFYTMAFLGTAPIGSLIAGCVAQRIGAPATICRRHLLYRLGSVVLRQPPTAPRGDPPDLRAEGAARRAGRGYGDEDAVGTKD